VTGSSPPHEWVKVQRTNLLRTWPNAFCRFRTHEATKLRGEADAAAIRVKIEAAGGVEGYTRQLQAQAALNWKGGLPQIMGAGSTQFPLILPLQLDEKAK